jgi:hypothetical protein
VSIVTTPDNPVARIRHNLVGLRMPRALEALEAVIEQIERGQLGALEAIDTLLAEEITGSWRVDETYIKVKGVWTYLYRAVDSLGQTIDFLLSVRRDTAADARPGPRGLVGLDLAAGGSQRQARHVARGPGLGQLAASPRRQRPCCRTSRQASCRPPFRPDRPHAAGNVSGSTLGQGAGVGRPMASGEVSRWTYLTRPNGRVPVVTAFASFRAIMTGKVSVCGWSVTAQPGRRLSYRSPATA